MSFSPGDLIVYLRETWEGDLVVFLHAYGFSNHGTNWKRNEWNLKVLSPTLGIVWVSDEYTGGVE